MNKPTRGAARPRAGRPEIGRATTLRLPPELVAKIDGARGDGESRAAAIRRLLESALDGEEIWDQLPGRTISRYDLLDEMVDTYGLSRREAHDSIHAFLEQIIGIQGREKVVISDVPSQPELLDSNPGDLDIRYWWIITHEAAQEIREAFAAVYTSDDYEDRTE